MTTSVTCKILFCAPEKKTGICSKREKERLAKLPRALNQPLAQQRNSLNLTPRCDQPTMISLHPQRGP
jgi:hypothetical protein